MNDLFAILILFGLIGLVVGLIKPTLFRIKSRKNALYIFGGLTVLFFILFGVTEPPTQTTTTTPVVAKADVQNPPAVPLTDEQKVENAIAPLLQQSPLQASYDHSGLSGLIDDNLKDPSNKQQDVEIAIDTGPVSSDDSYITNTGLLTSNIFQKVFALNSNFVRVMVFYRGPVTDQYGNATTSEVMDYAIDRSLYNKINWAGISNVQNDIHLCAFLREQFNEETSDEQATDSKGVCGVSPYDLRTAENKIEADNRVQYPHIPQYPN